MIDTSTYCLLFTCNLFVVYANSYGPNKPDDATNKHDDANHNRLSELQNIQIIAIFSTGFSTAAGMCVFLINRIRKHMTSHIEICVRTFSVGVMLAISIVHKRL